MTPRSLRWRLLAGSGLAVLVALVIAWVLMSLLFSRHLERRLTLEMTGDASRIVALLELPSTGTVALAEEPADPRYDMPVSGHYWQVSEGSVALLRSRSLWDADLPIPQEAPSNAWRLRRSPGPFSDPVVILRRAIRLGDGEASRTVYVQVARGLTEIASAQSEFAREMALFLSALWVFLMGATWVQVRLGLVPLKEAGVELNRLRADSAHRMSAPRVAELAPLVQAINDLAEARAADLKRARGRASDLAHGLKTPLAALMTQSARLRRGEASEAAEGLDRAIHAIRVAIDSELTRNRIAILAPGSTSVQEPVEQLVSVLEHTERGGSVVFSVEIPDDIVAPLIREDLIEMLGPLLDNAVRFCRRRVTIAAHRTEAGLELSIDDDGPGIAPDRIPAAILRGVRLDEQGLGQGLGLSIAKAIAEASGGELILRPSPLGGLRAVIRWPAGQLEKSPLPRGALSIA